jgi:hypothetical protein
MVNKKNVDFRVAKTDKKSATKNATKSARFT